MKTERQLRKESTEELRRVFKDEQQLADAIADSHHEKVVDLALSIQKHLRRADEAIRRLEKIG